MNRCAFRFDFWQALLRFISNESKAPSATVIANSYDLNSFLRLFGKGCKPILHVFSILLGAGDVMPSSASSHENLELDRLVLPA